jgi:hypothetical protein
VCKSYRYETIVHPGLDNWKCVPFLPLEYWQLNCQCSVHCSWIDHFLVVTFLHVQKCGSV